MSAAPRRLDVDVAIIGAGMVGTSAALALRTAGLSVAIFDKGFCGAGASGVNFGGVRRQGRPMVQLALSMRAHRVWQGLAARIGIDGEFVASGHLKLARTQADMASLEAYAAQAAHEGLALELLGPNQLRARFGWISNDIVGGSLSPGDGHANPRLVAAGFGAAARRAGAQLFEQAAILGLTRTGAGFALETATGLRITARHVVNSAGAWAGRFAADAGEAVPLERIYPSMIVTEPLPPQLTVNIGIEGGGIYARQVARGNCIVGGQRGAALADADFSRPTAGGMRGIMAMTAALFPGLGHAQVIRAWTGTEGALPDSQPVLGHSITTPGLVHAFGFAGAGFQIAPGVGEVVADLVLTGTTQTPISAFSIQRFVPGPIPGA